MTAGAGMFPGDDEVDQLWIEMDAAARAPERLAVGRILEPGVSEPNSEFLKRCEAVEEAMKRGLWTEIPESADRKLLEDYVVGAEILAASLAATGHAFCEAALLPLVALVTDGLSASAREALQKAGVDTPQARGFFSKIWLWALPFDKVIYIDTDILQLEEHCPGVHFLDSLCVLMWVLENLDHVFETYGHCEFAAAADSQPHMDGEMISQTGFLVLQPCPERFSELWVLCSGSNRPMKLDDWKHFEQGGLPVGFQRFQAQQLLCLETLMGVDRG
eukprot:Skav224857  [mRNA]  locus=scaffold322:144875:150466:+ [translate_table: standard]